MNPQALWYGIALNGDARSLARRRAHVPRQLPVLDRPELAGRRQAHDARPLRRADARLHDRARRPARRRARPHRRPGDARRRGCRADVRVLPGPLFVEPGRADGGTARRRADRDRRRMPIAAAAGRAPRREGRSGRAGRVDRGMVGARGAHRAPRRARRGGRASLVGRAQVPARLHLLVHRRADDEPQGAGEGARLCGDGALLRQQRDADAGRRSSRCASRTKARRCRRSSTVRRNRARARR